MLDAFTQRTKFDTRKKIYDSAVNVLARHILCCRRANHAAADSAINPSQHGVRQRSLDVAEKNHAADVGAILGLMNVRFIEHHGFGSRCAPRRDPGGKSVNIAALMERIFSSSAAVVCTRADVAFVEQL